MTTMTKPTDWPGIGTGFVKIVKDWAQCQLVCQSMTAEFALVRPPSRLGTKPHRGLVPRLSAGMASEMAWNGTDWHRYPQSVPIRANPLRELAVG